MKKFHTVFQFLQYCRKNKLHLFTYSTYNQPGHASGLEMKYSFDEVGGVLGESETLVFSSGKNEMIFENVEYILLGDTDGFLSADVIIGYTETKDIECKKEQHLLLNTYEKFWNNPGK